MSIATVYRCDHCKIERKETNHWFVVQIGVRFGQLMIHKWTNDLVASLANAVGVEHYCGRECLNHRLNVWIESSKIFMFHGVANHPEPGTTLTVELTEEGRRALTNLDDVKCGYTIPNPPKLS